MLALASSKPPIGSSQASGWWTITDPIPPWVGNCHVGALLFFAGLQTLLCSAADAQIGQVQA